MLPAELRELDSIEAGQEFDVERITTGEYRLRRRVSRNTGVIDWLLSCPEKGYFVPIDTEATNKL